MIQTAIIGISGYAAFHLQILREQAQRGAVRLCAAAVINRHEEKALCAALEREGCQIFPDHESMLEAWRSRLDLCVIPTAPHWHARMAVAALEAGANVLLEKPLAPTPDEVTAIQEAEARTGRWVAVGFQDLHSPEVHTMKQLIRSGEIGRLRRVAGRCIWPRPVEYYSRNSWAGRLRVDGQTVLDSPLSNAMAHFPMAMLFIAGTRHGEAARFLTEEADLRRVYPIESFDTFTLRGVLECGAHFHFEGTHSGQRPEGPIMVFQGTEGEIRWTHQDSATVKTKFGTQTLRVSSADETRRLLIGDVLRRHLDPTVFVCSTRLAAEHAALYHRLHISHAVREFPDARVVHTREDGKHWRRIEGVHEQFARTMETFLAGAEPAGARLSEV